MQAWPALQLSTDSLAFGSVPVGASETRSFTLTNDGGSPATITASTPPSSVGLSTPSTGLSEGALLAPGASVVASVTFAPGTTGAASSSWLLDANDGLGRAPSPSPARAPPPFRPTCR